MQAIRERFTGQILYLDVDAFVHSDPWPYLETLRGDLAVHYRRGKELLSGTILLNDTSGCRLALAAWADLCRTRRMWDQRLLAQALARLEGRVAVDRLPPEFTFIFDSMRREHHGLVPVIEHLQASRNAGRAKARVSSAAAAFKTWNKNWANRPLLARPVTWRLEETRSGPKTSFGFCQPAANITNNGP